MSHRCLRPTDLLRPRTLSPPTQKGRGRPSGSTKRPGLGPGGSGGNASPGPSPSRAGRKLRSAFLERGSCRGATPGRVARRVLRKVARTEPKAVSSWQVGYALRSPLLAETGDERTLPLSLSKWLKSSLVKLSENPHGRANLLAIRRLIAA